VARKQLPTEALVNLRQRLNLLPVRAPERRELVEQTAELYGVSPDTVYRALREFARPKSLKRKDAGVPRKISRDDLSRYCEIIAALKVRTSNKKGRHLSTTRAIQIMEDYGVETPDGLVKLPKGYLTLTTANRYLKHWGMSHEQLSRQPPAVSLDDSTHWLAPLNNFALNQVVYWHHTLVQYSEHH